MQTVNPQISVAFFFLRGEVPVVSEDGKRHECYLDIGLPDTSSLNKINAPYATNMPGECPGPAPAADSSSSQDVIR